MRSTLLRALAFLMLLSLPACHKASPLGPGASFSGTWTGVIEDTHHTTGALRLMLTQDDHVVSGSWSTTFEDASKNGGGAAVGTAIDTRIQLSLLAPGTTTCENGAVVNGTLTISAGLTGSHLTGEYTTFVCDAPGFAAGTIDVTKS
jgi:hypothetical protein